MDRLDWPADVPSTPPAWCEQEWCDGGWTCEHAACMEEWADEANAEQRQADALDGGHDW